MLDVTIAEHEIKIGPRFSVTFQRTLRIPDDGGVYPLPPGLGVFPILKVADYADRVPAHWNRDSALIPMYQREALWLGFDGDGWKPNAVQIAIGGVNALSGETFEETLRSDPQNYIVAPDQPWLDGINAGSETIRQFVAMPLGLGYTVEASITGREDFGGIQIRVVEPKAGIFPDKPPSGNPGFAPRRAVFAEPEMGLGAGGVMRQKVYPDNHGIEVWDQDNFGEVFIHIVNSAQFEEITGRAAPASPVDAKAYTDYGFPWFALYDEHLGDVAASERLSAVRTISKRDSERGHMAGNTDSVDVSNDQIRKLRF
ncbi:MAG: hypothetical protein ACR2G6_06720 [Gemmatimonadaceae bacterium]